MNKTLLKSAVAHRRLARVGTRRLRAVLRGDESRFTVEQLARHIDANRRMAAMDFAAAKEVTS